MTSKTVAKRCSFSGVGFSIKTIIPDTREHLFTPTNLLNTYPIGGFGLSRVLDAPPGLRVADGPAVGIGVGADIGGVYRHQVSQARQPFLEAVNQASAGLFHEIQMVGEAADKSVERGAVRQNVPEPA